MKPALFISITFYKNILLKHNVLVIVFKLFIFIFLFMDKVKGTIHFFKWKFMKFSAK